MNRDRTIDSDAERYYGGASEVVPGLRSRRDEYDPDVDDSDDDCCYHGVPFSEECEDCEDDGDENLDIPELDNEDTFRD